MTNGLDQIIEKYKGQKGNAIPILQELQIREGYLPEDSIRYISEKTNIPAAELFGIATFYSMFRLKPRGRHIVRICKGTACHVSGADTLSFAIRTHLKLFEEDDTTDDGRFTLLEVACLGCCSLAPVIMIDDSTYGKLTSDKVVKILDQYE
ncbi:MAG: NADH-quinone oxidoreductase subunit NuoE [Candidatus Marinimicrobia bacterium]|nr:NADH-quinone oxidoreductase subunit NuoE [Candidatus Neomarinimicrobiota bacterium]